MCKFVLNEKKKKEKEKKASLVGSTTNACSRFCCVAVADQ